MTEWRKASQDLGEHTGFEMPLSASATLRAAASNRACFLAAHKTWPHASSRKGSIPREPATNISSRHAFKAVQLHYAYTHADSVRLFRSAGFGEAQDRQHSATKGAPTTSHSNARGRRLRCVRRVLSCRVFLRASSSGVCNIMFGLVRPALTAPNPG